MIPHTVPCDLCESPMRSDTLTRADDGAILGLLVCTLCVEDQLEARQFEQETAR